MTLFEDVVSSCSFSPSSGPGVGEGDAESGGDSGREVVGYGVDVPEREMPRISSMAVADFEARRLEARKRAR